MLSEKQSHASSGQCVCSGQTGISQKCLLPLQNCCAIGAAPEQQAVHMVLALHTFSWPQPRVPGVHTPETTPKSHSNNHCRADKQGLVTVQTHYISDQDLLVPILPCNTLRYTELEIYRQAHFDLSIYIHPPSLTRVCVSPLSPQSYTLIYYTHRNIQ